uniref:Galectin domain-containing protein n=1 Tax=Kalanchoe fedtschenkoi TaxID=63787 RepID=A0A7N0V7G5_KALFE
MKGSPLLRKRYGYVIIMSLIMILVLRYGVMKNAITGSYLSNALPSNSTNVNWLSGVVPSTQNPENSSQVYSPDTVVSGFFDKVNTSLEDHQSLKSWKHLKQLVSNPQVLPNAVEAVKEAQSAWHGLIVSVEEHNNGHRNTTREKQCPFFLNNMNMTELGNSEFRLRVPCGLTQGSSITIIGIPNGLLGNFRIDLTGEALPGEPDPAIILHYNVRLQGDKITEEPVIVQNTWTIAHDWGEEERCPPSTPKNNKKVDELDNCNQLIGEHRNRTNSRYLNGSSQPSAVQQKPNREKFFPFNQGRLFVATLRVGLDGIHTTVDGKHISSFAYRESLEPWLASEVRILGDLELISVVASGLPTSEEIDHVVDLEALKSVPLPPRAPLDLLIGVFSTANNFKRRMAVRRTWMQYPAVRSGTVGVRFFVGLHKNQIVNEELWREAQTYGDIQLMPFVDYYSLLTWKTVAICIFGTEVVSAKYVMKTDDDALVRVDEVLQSLNRISLTQGLLYGLIESDSQPNRDPDSKWFISREEWPDEHYPPWAHGPGYVISNDIAKSVYSRHRNGTLKMFKLEDVAMGIWIADMEKDGLKVVYEKDERINADGCTEGYIVAHYQSPREMLCLWKKLTEEHVAKCCAD